MPEQPTPRAAAFPWLAVASVGLLTLLLVAEYGLFRRHAQREITWIYPDHFDQAAYLGATYATYEGFRTEGVWPVLRRELLAGRPTSVLFPTEGSLFVLLLGPSRLSALTVHFAHYALLQVALFATLHWLTRRWSAAWLGLGLLLAAATPFAPSGGMFDYRIDFTALCLFGTLLCLVARSRLFASWPWAALAGAAGSWLVLIRPLTVVYVAGIFGLAFLYAGWAWWRGRADVRRRLAGLLAAGAALALLTGPYFWSARQALYEYYGVNYVLSARSDHFRNVGIGVVTLFDSLAYYPRTLGQQHLGPVFLGLAVLLPAAAVAFRFLRRRAAQAGAPTLALDRAGLWLLAGAGMALPYVVLSFYTVKNAAVIGIIVPGLVGLLAVVTVALGRASRAGLAVLAALAVAGGGYTQVSLSRAPGPFVRPRWGYTRIGQLYDAIGDACREMGWTSPQVSCTCIETDYFQPVVIPAYVYERQHLLLSPRSGKLGNYLWAVTEEEVLAEIRQSDLVLLVDPAQAPSAYPFDNSIRPMYHKLQEYCAANLTPLKRIQIWQFDVILYTRPTGTERARARAASAH